MVNRTRPSTTGNQPPSRILAPLAIRKPTSAQNNSTQRGNTHLRPRGHSARATSASSRGSISIVPATEDPYAVATALDEPHATTRPHTSTPNHHNTEERPVRN